MKSTFHKWVFKVMTDPNRTQYTKSGKYKVKNQNSRLARNLSEIGFRVFVVAPDVRLAPRAGGADDSGA